MGYKSLEGSCVAKWMGFAAKSKVFLLSHPVKPKGRPGFRRYILYRASGYNLKVQETRTAHDFKYKNPFLCPQCVAPAVEYA